jgi:hypothetical protein
MTEETLKRKADQELTQETEKKSAVVDISPAEVAVKVEKGLVETAVSTKIDETTVTEPESDTVAAPVSVDQGMEEMVYKLKLDNLSQKVTKKVIMSHVNGLVSLLPGLNF